MVSDDKERVGEAMWPGWDGVMGPSHPKAHPPESQLPLLQLPGRCGGNRNSTGTLIHLINSLCSSVVAIRPAVWAALGAGQGSPRLLAPCLPAQPLLATCSVPGARGQTRQLFCHLSSLASVHLPTHSHSGVFIEHLLCAKETAPIAFRCGWKSVLWGRAAGDAVTEMRGAWSGRED